MSSQRPKLKLAGKRASLLAVVLAIFITGMLVGRSGFTSAGADGNFDDQDGYSTLEQTWDLIQSQYVDPSTIDSDELFHAAAKGMVNALGDTGHSTFLDPLEVQTPIRRLAANTSASAWSSISRASCRASSRRSKADRPIRRGSSPVM
jgi:C-terminal processing protease CtpA/Prc